MHNIMIHRYLSRMEPESVIGSLASWQTKYDMHFIFAGDGEGRRGTAWQSSGRSITNARNSRSSSNLMSEQGIMRLLESNIIVT